MPDLNETTLSLGCDDRQQAIALPTATTGGTPTIAKDDFIYTIDGEGMRVQQVLVVSATAGLVQVTRGVTGQATPHAGGMPVITGSANRFYGADPSGLPAGTPLNNPWVNTKDKRVWRAQGDQAGPGSLSVAHTWQLQVVSTPVGALGVRSLVVTPNSTP